MMTGATVVVKTDAHQRVTLYPQGGLQVEALVSGIGWVVDTDADDDAVSSALGRVAEAIQAARCNLSCLRDWSVEEILAREG